LERIIYSQEGTCDMLPKLVNKMRGKLDNTSLRDLLFIPVLVTHTHIQVPTCLSQILCGTLDLNMAQLLC